tara:strand:+ start:12473 stop:12721 length:249 start_codon:yes stop_codon:yes gene_type:complete
MFSYIKMNKLDDKIKSLIKFIDSISANKDYKPSPEYKNLLEYKLKLYEEKLESMYEQLEELEFAENELRDAEYELSESRKIK